MGLPVLADRCWTLPAPGFQENFARTKQGEFEDDMF